MKTLSQTSEPNVGDNVAALERNLMPADRHHTFVLRLREEPSLKGEEHGRWHSNLIAVKSGKEIHDVAGNLWQLLRQLVPRIGDEINDQKANDLLSSSKSGQTADL